MSNPTRKELLNSPDQFMSASATTLNWIRSNRKAFTAGVTAAILIIGGSSAGYYWNKDRQHDAMNAVYAATENPKALQVVINDYAGTKAAKVAQLKLSRQSFAEGDYKKAQERAAVFCSKWNAKDSLFWQARQLEAASQLAQGDNAMAAATFAECAANNSDELRDQALFQQAVALNNLKKPEEAQKVLSQIKGDYQAMSRSFGG